MGHINRTINPRHYAWDATYMRLRARYKWNTSPGWVRKVLKRRAKSKAARHARHLQRKLS